MLNPLIQCLWFSKHPCSSWVQSPFSIFQLIQFTNRANSSLEHNYMHMRTSNIFWKNAVTKHATFRCPICKSTDQLNLYKTFPPFKSFWGLIENVTHPNSPFLNIRKIVNYHVQLLTIEVIFEMNDFCCLLNFVYHLVLVHYAQRKTQMNSNYFKNLLYGYLIHPLGTIPYQTNPSKDI